jgi:hypothetical protein
LANFLHLAYFTDFLAGGYSVLYCCFVTAPTDDPTTGLFVYGVFGFERGLGSILAGPVSSSLVSKDIDAQASSIGKYDRLIDSSARLCWPAQSVVKGTFLKTCVSTLFAYTRSTYDLGFRTFGMIKTLLSLMIDIKGLATLSSTKAMPFRGQRWRINRKHFYIVLNNENYGRIVYKHRACIYVVTLGQLKMIE